MKKRISVLLLALFLLSASNALANDTSDPPIIITGGNSPTASTSDVVTSVVTSVVLYGISWTG